MSVADKLTTIAENQEKVYEAGAAVAQKKPFVDTSKGMTNHEYLFAGGRLLDQIDRFDFSNLTNAAYMFQNSQKLVTLPAIDTSKATRMLYYCYNCQYLVTIEGVDFSSCTVTGAANNAFHNCVRLETVVINGTIPCDLSFGSCRVLSKKTIEDVVRALSASVTGKTITFNQSAVNAAFTTDQWNTLVASKPNWRFDLA